LENPNYGKHSLSTLKKIAATCDVALVVWFIPFSRLLDWVTGSPYRDDGLSEGFYNIPTFGDEFGTNAVGVGSLASQSFDQAKQRPPSGRAESGMSDSREMQKRPIGIELGSVLDQEKNHAFA